MNRANAGSDKLPVILLFGMPRSGTTWMAKLIDSHPAVYYKHEPDLFLPMEELGHFLTVGDAAHADGKPSAPEQILMQLPSISHSTVVGKRPYFSKNFIGPVRNKVFQANLFLVSVAKHFLNIELPIFEPISSKKNFTLLWKSIESLGRMDYFIGTDYPVKGLHLVRHPCGYIASVLRGEVRNKFTGGGTTSEDFGMFERMLATDEAKSHGLTMAGIKTMMPVERLAWRWVVFNEFTLNHCKTRENYMLVSYERLCLETSSMMKKILAFCELPEVGSVSQFINDSSSTEVDSYYSVYKDSQHAAFKWRRELSEDDQSAIMAIVDRSPELKALYPE